MYQKFDSMYGRHITGSFAIKNDPYQGYIISGSYDNGKGDWYQSYLVTRLLASGSMIWTAKDDVTDISRYKRCDEVPAEILKECKDLTRRIKKERIICKFCGLFALFVSLPSNLSSGSKFKDMILTITGSDSTGGSGVQADIRTISELGGYAVSAITSITVQNTLGIQEFFDIPAEIVSGQIEAIMNDMQPDIVKIGMIRRVETLNVVIDALTKYRPAHIIYAPAIWSSQGDALMTEDVVSQIKYRLLPLCSVVVSRKKESDIILQNSKLLSLAEKQGLRIYRLDNANSHGLINRFSSALAVYLNQGKKMEEALAMAQDFINVELVRQSNLQGRSSELYNQFISQVNNFCRTYSDVHFYADQLNVSGRYLAQVTRRISGKTPKAIIDEYIVKEIERELSTTTHTVQEIANTFGFSSQAHLTKFFKKMRGVTPSAFRQPKPVD